MPEIRRATLDDLDAMHALEQAAFQPWRQASRASLRRSLTSRLQQVWVFDDGAIQGSLIVWAFPRSLRLYGLAVAPARQGQGVGRALMAHAEQLARGRTLLLEADASDTRLLTWYEGLGYARHRLRPDFYGPGRDAWRMIKSG